MISFCWKCHKEVDLPIHFKTVCDHCLAYLHCCQGCRFYQEGKPNDCLIPGTEQVRDRDANNYCEEFKLNTKRKSNIHTSIEEISKNLFND